MVDLSYPFKTGLRRLVDGIRSSEKKIETNDDLGFLIADFGLEGRGCHWRLERQGLWKIIQIYIVHMFYIVKGKVLEF